MKWIKVCNRLPEEYTFVLVFADNQGTNEPKPFSIATLMNNNWNFINKSSCMQNYGAYMDIQYPMDSDEVTHWMPLPEMPEVENEMD